MELKVDFSYDSWFKMSYVIYNLLNLMVWENIIGSI